MGPAALAGHAYPRQLHLDIHVDDTELAEQQLLDLGAARVLGAPETDFRLFTDPAGRPCCIVFSHQMAA